jgi:SAM-dependent methyltransferase
MHAAALEFVWLALAESGRRAGMAPRQVYEIGSRDINGSIRQAFPEAEVYLGVDLLHGPGVDVVADGATYTPPFTPDCVVCCEVLEHSPHPGAIVRQAWRVLAQGGLFVVTCATDPRPAHSGIHGMRPMPGEYYRNLSERDLRAMVPARHLTTLVDTTAGDLGLWVIKR